MILVTLLPQALLLAASSLTSFTVIAADTATTSKENDDQRAGGWSMPAGKNPSSGQNDPGGVGAQPHSGGQPSGTTATGTDKLTGAFKCAKLEGKTLPATKGDCEKAGGTWQQVDKGATAK